MKLRKIIIQNFLSIKQATINLLDRGLVSIEGKTLDTDGANSNGSGKSTLINAIMWCNYDDPGKNLKSVDDVVNTQVGKDCMVQCVWYDEDNSVDYIITRYRKHTKYKNAITIQHESGTDLSKGTNAETQRAINDLLGGDKSTFEASCFARQEDAPDIPGMTDTELKSLLEKVLPVDQLAPLYKVAQKNLSDHKDLVNRLERDEYTCEITICNLKESIEYIQKQIDGWSEEVKDIKGAKDDLLTLFVKRVEDYQWRIDATPTIPTLQKMYSKLNDFVDSFDKKTHDKVKEDWAIARNRYKLAKKELDSTSSECPTCLREFEDVEQKIKIGEANVAKAISLLKVLKPSFDEQELLYGKCIDDSLEASEVHSRILAKQELIRDKNLLEDKIKELKEERDRVTDNPHLESLKKLQERLKLAEAELSTVDKRLDAERARLSILEAVAETYSPKGVRYHLLETLTPQLNERTNYYLTQLTDGAMKAIWSTVTKTKSGEYREKFSIDVRGKEFTNYGSLSGGEKRKVKLACFFALQDVISKRATKFIDFMAVDEIDHALDSGGLERLTGLLVEKKKSTILVISHNDMKEWIPNSIKVIKEGGISRIED